MKNTEHLAWTALLLLVALPAAAEQFRGTVIDAGGAVPRASSTPFTLKIEQYTSDEEALGLARLLAQQGPEALRRELEKIDHGWIRFGSRLGYPISFARSFDTPEGRVIRVATDRPVAFIEARNLLRTMDYPFGILELRLPPEGKGSGRLIVAAEVRFDDKGVLQIESYGLEPFRILQARVAPEKKKKKKDKGQ